MLSEFPTFRYNNVNKASKTIVKNSCYSDFFFILLIEKQSRIPSAEISKITWKNGTHESIAKYILCKLF